MKIFTSHIRAGEPPVLVREGFSWAAFLFGFLYLAAHRAWIQSALNLATLLLLLAIDRGLGSGAPMLGLALLQGIFGRDLLRWNLAQRGYLTGPTVAAADHDQAFARLLGARADLIPHAARADPIPQTARADLIPDTAGATP